MPPVKRKLSFSSPSPRYPVTLLDRPGPASKTRYTPRSQRLVDMVKPSKPSQFRTVRRARVGVSSKSAGYLKTSSTKSKYNKKYRKRAKFVSSGVTQILETGGTVSGSASNNDTTYVGHSFGLFSMKYNAWWAVLRELFIKAGVRVDNFAKGATLTDLNGPVAGDVVSVSYRPDANSNLLSSSYTVVVANTVDTMIRTFLNNFNSKDDIFYDLRYIPVASSPVNAVVMRLDQTILHFDMKADLKIQNRTVNISTEDQSDDVNNCPIHGKSIEGNANGAEIIGLTSASNYSLAANENHGLISMAPSVDELAEPLDYQRFKPVSKIGKIHLDPGQIKTSVLYKQFRVTFNKFFQYMNPQSAAASDTATGKQLYNPYVKYRIFALEKMLDANAAASKTAVILAVENNVKINTRVTSFNRNVTNVTFFKGNLQ